MLIARTRILVMLMLASIFHAAAPWRVDAQEASHLKGLTSVAVHVQNIGNYPTTMSAVQLERDVEERLRQAGITIGSREAPKTFGTQAGLWATTIVLPPIVRWGDAQMGLVLQTQLRVYGSVVLAGSNERTEAITWETDRIEVVPVADIGTRLVANLNYLVDDFSKAYISVNPK